MRNISGDSFLNYEALQILLSAPYSAWNTERTHSHGLVCAGNARNFQHAITHIACANSVCPKSTYCRVRQCPFALLTHTCSWWKRELNKKEQPINYKRNRARQRRASHIGMMLKKDELQLRTLKIRTLIVKLDREPWGHPYRSSHLRYILT